MRNSPQALSQNLEAEFAVRAIRAIWSIVLVQVLLDEFTWTR